MVEILAKFEIITKAFENEVSNAIKERNLGITKDQWRIINCVSEFDVISQKDISIRTQKDPAAITRMLDLLEKKQLTKRVTSKDDRRSFDISLTVNGSRLIRRFRPVFQQIQEQFLHSFTKAQKEQLINLLDQLA